MEAPSSRTCLPPTGRRWRSVRCESAAGRFRAATRSASPTARSGRVTASSSRSGVDVADDGRHLRRRRHRLAGPAVPTPHRARGRLRLQGHAAHRCQPGGPLRRPGLGGTGFEIVQSHRPDWKFTAPQTVADGGLHGRLLVGRKRSIADLAPDAGSAPSHAGRCPGAPAQGGSLVEEGAGANVLDSPLHALLHFLVELRSCPGATDLALATSSPPAPGPMPGRCRPARRGRPGSTRPCPASSPLHVTRALARGPDAPSEVA